MTDQLIPPEPEAGRGGARRGAGRPLAPKSGAVARVQEALGISQEQLAREIGCSLNAVRLMKQEGRLPAKPEVLKKFQTLARRAGVEIEIEVTP